MFKNLDEGFPKTTKLILAPGLGYATKAFDFRVYWQNFSGGNLNYTLTGIRVAYNFGR